MYRAQLLQLLQVPGRCVACCPRYYYFIDVLCFLQPLMTLLFAKLTQDFLVFQTAVAQADSGDQGAAERLPQVAKQFYHSSSLNASYLVYLGA